MPADFPSPQTAAFTLEKAAPASASLQRELSASVRNNKVTRLGHVY
jgi:hypothetical protein